MTLTYTKAEEDLIICDSFRELSYKDKKLFLAAHNLSVPVPEKYAAALIKRRGGSVYNNLEKRFLDRSYREEVLGAISRSGTHCVTIKSGGYPESLRSIKSAPLILYCRGNSKLLKKHCLAIVGSRRTAARTAEMTREFASKLAEHFTIITGVADGGDKAAAEGALKSGNIACILPCGSEYSAGGASQGLIREVEKHGLVVSEYAPTVKPFKFMYPLRNRILAGLSRGVFVVSAGEKSGAIMTANYALDFGRDVFAFAYPPNSPTGQGCNNLIKNGAAIVDCVQDILSAYGISAAKERTQGSVAALILTADERRVLETLRREGELHVGKLAEFTDKKVFEVLTIISSLEVKGLILRCGGNKFAPAK